jgi:2-amino-4-hydroxy-6-hydroxymethyldihydropteridine diphosphokinase
MSILLRGAGESPLHRVTRAYVGFGANLGDPAAAVRAAIAECASLGTVEAVSPLYRSAPVGVTEQPEFVNAVAELGTSLEPLQLLTSLQGIENAHGRVRAERWGPRTLDLDLLWYDGVESDDPTLTLPHPRALEREFVLRPWVDIAPQLVVGGRPLGEWLRLAGDQGVWPFE